MSSQKKIIDCEKIIPLNNKLGTCWNLVILSILFYSNITGADIQNKLEVPFVSF